MAPAILERARSLPFLGFRRRRRSPSRASTAPPAAWSLPLPAGTHVGLAQVVSIQPDGRPRVRLHDGAAEVTATWALPFLYEASEGDLLHVIGRQDRYYALAVVSGQGRSILAFAGDAELEAASTLRLAAAKGVRIMGKRLKLQAETIEALGTTIQLRATDVVRQVKGVTRLVAGRVQQVVTGTSSVVGRESVTVQSHRAVKIDCNDVIAIG